MQKLYYGGDIITMVREEDAAEALLIQDGKIKYVGTLSEAEALCGSDTERVDLAGNAIMPSFIDGHSHISMYSQFSSFPDVSECTSFDEIVAFLKQYLFEHPMTEKDVLFVVGYDHNFLKEQAHPTRDILDRVSQKVPIYLYHSSGHMGVINTALMQQVGLKEDAKDPEGGHYGRYEDGTFNGYLEEMAAFAPVMVPMFERLHMDPVKQMAAVQDIYLKNGVTTVQDGATSRQTFEGFTKLAENHVFKLDVVSYIMDNDKPNEVMAEHPEYVSGYRNHLKIGGAKILLDGSPQGKSAWLTEPYEGEESYRGYGTHKDEEVVEAALCAIENGYQLLAHSNGDAASDQFVRCYRAALEKSSTTESDLRPVMIHCQTVRDDQLEEMARIGMLPSIFVAHTYYWGDVHRKNLGERRASRVSPVHSALTYGLKYNFHQDCPVLPPDVMRTIWCAVNRITRTGARIGEEQCIGVFDALKGVTIHAAYAYHEENLKGTLEPGKLADLVILDKNPLKVDTMEIKDIRVLETIKEGETLYKFDMNHSEI